MHKKIRVSIGITAYNEEKNLEELLKSIIEQKLTHAVISEILIISSGSTDNTNKIAKRAAAKYSHIKLINQKKRLGKASAVNLFLSRAKEEVVLLCSADVILSKRAIDQITKHMRDKLVGIVGSHPIPLNNSNTFFGFAAHLLWDLHHKTSLKDPKMGECIAFRKIFKQIPSISSVDEANIESLIKGQGYKAVYEPAAVIYNMGAENLRDFILRRRHIFAGHIATKQNYGYEVSTINGLKTFFLLLQNVEFSWRFFLWTPVIVLLEVYSRILGYLDYKFKLKKHTIWEITPSTKKLPAAGRLNA